jgi:hypothetical protein
MSQNSNYGGRQPNSSSYIKSFNTGQSFSNWNYVSNNNMLTLTPSNPNATVYITGDLFVGGSINNPSDIHLKDNIENLSLSLSEKIMILNPVKYNYKDDENQKVHFGFIAQDVEKQFPNLVNTVSTNIDDTEVSFKSVNYLEMIPILLLKIKDLQNQIDLLNNKILDK